jgi:hypothetical protein
MAIEVIGRFERALGDCIMVLTAVLVANRFVPTENAAPTLPDQKGHRKVLI